MISVHQKDDVWTVTLNRADKANALTLQMLKELTDIAISARHAKVFILTGAGRVFSAGADLEQAANGLAVSDQWERLSAAVAEIQGLTIAALNGTVAGGAFGMVLACDMRIAVPTAKFFYPVMRLGFKPQPSDVLRMRALIGPARTKMILMAGQKLDAQTALGFGLIDQVVEADVMPRAHELAADALTADSDHIHGIKAMIDG